MQMLPTTCRRFLHHANAPYTLTLLTLLTPLALLTLPTSRALPTPATLPKLAAPPTPQTDVRSLRNFGCFTADD